MKTVITKPDSNAQENNPFIVKISPSSSRSNLSWLTKKNLITGILALGTITAAAVTVYYLSARSTLFANHEPVNQSSLSLFNIYTDIENPDEELINYNKCKGSFAAHWATFKSCGTTLCDCIRNARNVFEKHCLEYAKNIANTTQQCQEAENAIHRCKERLC